MILLVPFDLYHTAVARLPSEDRDSAGLLAFAPMAERSYTAPQLAVLPEMVADAAWIMVLVPFDLSHIAAALVPSEDRRTFGSMAVCPVAERSDTEPQLAVLPEMVAEAAWMM